MAGVAVVMIVSQLERMTGVPVDADGIVPEIVAFLSNLGAVHLPTLALSATVVVFLLVVRRFAPALPGPLIAVVGATVLVAVLNLEAAGVALVGEIPSGLPRFGLPAVGLSDVPILVASALGIAVVGYTDVILTARSFAKRDEPIDPNAELFALGGANLASGLSSGMPVSSSASRTAIAESVGGRSQATAIVTAICVVLVLLLAGGLLARFPIAALGGLVVYAALRLIDVAEFRRLARFRPTELGLALAATAGVLVVDVLAGILIAVALSVVALFARVARPKAAVLGRPPVSRASTTSATTRTLSPSPDSWCSGTTRRWCSRTPTTSRHGRWKQSTRLRRPPMAADQRRGNRRHRPDGRRRAGRAARRAGASWRGAGAGAREAGPARPARDDRDDHAHRPGVAVRHVAGRRGSVRAPGRGSPREVWKGAPDDQPGAPEGAGH